MPGVLLSTEDRRGSEVANVPSEFLANHQRGQAFLISRPWKNRLAPRLIQVPREVVLRRQELKPTPGKSSLCANQRGLTPLIVHYR